MPKKERNVSPIKQRISQFVDYLHISKREFYMKTSISRGTLDNSTGITEETMTKILATYQNINPSWLITGKGSMIIDFSEETAGSFSEIDNVDSTKNKFEDYDNICQICKEKDRIIDSLKDQINHYQKEIEWLRSRIEYRDGTKIK